MANQSVDELALRYLKGLEGSAPAALDHGRIAGLFWDWEQKLKGTPRGNELAQAIARRLADPDREVRFHALQFLEAIDLLPAHLAVLPFVRGKRDSFKGQRSVGNPSVDLEWHLLRVLNKLIETNDEARQLAMREALDPDGQPRAIIAELAYVAPDWLRQHRDEIERLHPDTKTAIANNLK